MARSSIEWTESTWNPLTGCQKISPGCKHCYAERMALRLQAMGQPNYQNGFRLTLHLSGAGVASILEEATNHFCQFHERPLPG